MVRPQPSGLKEKAWNDNFAQPVSHRSRPGIIGGILYFVAAAQSIECRWHSECIQLTSAGDLARGLIVILLLIVGGIFSLIAWIGALIKTAKLGQWLWFILLIVFSGITMLVYIFAGPTKPANSGQMA